MAEIGVDMTGSRPPATWRAGPGVPGQQHHRRQTAVRARPDGRASGWPTSSPSARGPRRAPATPTSRAQFWRLARRIGKKKAAVAVGHSILVICWHLLPRRATTKSSAATTSAKRDTERARSRALRSSRRSAIASTLSHARPEPTVFVSGKAAAQQGASPGAVDPVSASGVRRRHSPHRTPRPPKDPRPPPPPKTARRPAFNELPGSPVRARVPRGLAPHDRLAGVWVGVQSAGAEAGACGRRGTVIARQGRSGQASKGDLDREAATLAARPCPWIQRAPHSGMTLIAGSKLCGCNSWLRCEGGPASGPPSSGQFVRGGVVSPGGFEPPTN